jgi:MFS family permease
MKADVIPENNANNRKPIYAVAIVTAICLLGDSMLYIVLPIYWREVGLSTLWEVGVLLSVNRLVRLPLNPLIGWLYKKISPRTGLVIAVALGALTTAGYGLWKGFAIWLVLRCIWGIAWSLLRIGGYLTVIICSDDSNRGQQMGTYNGLYRLGSLGGMLFGGILVPVIGIQAIALTFGAIALISIPFIMMMVSTTKMSGTTAAVPSSDSKLGSTLWTKPVMKVIATGLSVSLLYSVFSSTLTLVIDTNYGQTMSILGILLTSTALAGIIQAIRWMWEPFLAGRFGKYSDGPKGRLPLIMASLIGAAAGYALIPWKLPITIWVIIVLFIMLTATALTTLMDAMASDVARLSSVISVMTTYAVATDLGSALGPLLSYWFVEYKYGLLGIYLCSSLFYLLITFWIIPKKLKLTALTTK